MQGQWMLLVMACLAIWPSDTNVYHVKGQEIAGDSAINDRSLINSKHQNQRNILSNDLPGAAIVHNAIDELDKDKASGLHLHNTHLDLSSKEGRIHKRSILQKTTSIPFVVVQDVVDSNSAESAGVHQTKRALTQQDDSAAAAAAVLDEEQNFIDIADAEMDSANDRDATVATHRQRVLINPLEDSEREQELPQQAAADNDFNFEEQDDDEDPLLGQGARARNRQAAANRDQQGGGGHADEDVDYEEQGGGNPGEGGGELEDAVYEEDADGAHHIGAGRKDDDFDYDYDEGDYDNRDLEDVAYNEAHTGNTSDIEPGHLPAFEKDPFPVKRNITAWQARRGPHQEPVQEIGSATFLLPKHPEAGYVAACIVARDAHADIVEWIHYHLKLGIWPVYVYDHGSIPPMSGVLSTHMHSGAVVYQWFSAFTHVSGRPQLYAYDKCLQDHGHKHQWMMFFDTDEFLVFRKPPRVQSLPALLQSYEGYSALAVHWILFGSSGHVSRQGKGVVRSYFKCLPLAHDQHLFVKTIANTKCTVSTSDSPHYFIHNCSQPVVRTNLAPVEGQKATDIVYDTLALHHYTLKSQEEFMIKMARGSGMKRQRGWEYFWFVNKWSVDFNFDAMSMWDDDVAYQPLLDPAALAMQLEQYEQEQHEEFWGKAQQQQHKDGEPQDGQEEEQQQDALELIEALNKQDDGQALV